MDRLRAYCEIESICLSQTNPSIVPFIASAGDLKTTHCRMSPELVTVKPILSGLGSVWGRSLVSPMRGWQLEDCVAAEDQVSCGTEAIFEGLWPDGRWATSWRWFRARIPACQPLSISAIRTSESGEWCVVFDCGGAFHVQLARLRRASSAFYFILSPHRRFRLHRFSQAVRVGRVECLSGIPSQTFYGVAGFGGVGQFKRVQFLVRGHWVDGLTVVSGFSNPTAFCQAVV